MLTEEVKGQTLFGSHPRIRPRRCSSMHGMDKPFPCPLAYKLLVADHVDTYCTHFPSLSS
jgi:hypothetical protein